VQELQEGQVLEVPATDPGFARDVGDWWQSARADSQRSDAAADRACPSGGLPCAKTLAAFVIATYINETDKANATLFI